MEHPLIQRFIRYTNSGDRGRPAPQRRPSRMLGLCLAAFGFIAFAPARAAEPVTIDILYIWQAIERPPTLANRAPPPDNAGLAGAELGVRDSNSTGRFTGQTYRLTTQQVSSAEQAAETVTQWFTESSGLVVADLPDDSLLAVTQQLPADQSGVVINATNRNDHWRYQSCRSGLLHTAASHAMLADGLGQFFIARRWRDWLLVQGPRPADRAWSNAFKRTAKRYGAKIRDEKTWSFETDLRRTAQAELPLFTQASNYDVVLVADDLGDVGDFIPYNTWLPRPVAGTQGLVPTEWSPVIEQWGALQLQNRFHALAQRDMTADDYGAWAGVRSIAEAVTRTGLTDPRSLYNYMLSDNFELAGFKGRGLTFRPWNGQLRQPITLIQPRAVVSQSPQDGFLHPRTDMDTLGYDAAEVDCPF